MPAMSGSTPSGVGARVPFSSLRCCLRAAFSRWCSSRARSRCLVDAHAHGVGSSSTASSALADASQTVRARAYAKRVASSISARSAGARRSFASTPPTTTRTRDRASEMYPAIPPRPCVARARAPRAGRGPTSHRPMPPRAREANGAPRARRLSPAIPGLAVEEGMPSAHEFSRCRRRLDSCALRAWHSIRRTGGIEGNSRRGIVASTRASLSQRTRSRAKSERERAANENRNGA